MTDPSESEAALAASVALIGRLPGAAVSVEPDVTIVASGRPLAALNHVLRATIANPAGSDANDVVDARIAAIHDRLVAAGSVPATWWITPATAPPDLGARLQARGFVAAEREYGMVVDTHRVGSPADGVRAVETVGPELLDAWLDVMARAYAWSDPGGADAWAELYRAPIDEEARPWWHVLVRRNGRPAACASLFTAEGHAFVTNVGTVPEARGAGLGTTATMAVIGIARDLGYRQASLAASEMGRGVYLRIGFREDARLDRWISA